MTVQIVQFTAKEADVVDIDAAIEALMASIEQAQPAGTRYAWAKLADGVTFVGVLELEDGVDNPLLGMETARTFQRNLGNWAVGEPPAPQRLDVVCSYHLFEDSRRA